MLGIHSPHLPCIPFQSNETAHLTGDEAITEAKVVICNRLSPYHVLLQGLGKLLTDLFVAFARDKLPSWTPPGYSDIGLMPDHQYVQKASVLAVIMSSTWCVLMPEDREYLALQALPICMAQLSTPELLACLAQPSEPLATIVEVLPFAHALGEQLDSARAHAYCSSLRLSNCPLHMHHVSVCIPCLTDSVFLFHV